MTKRGRPKNPTQRWMCQECGCEFERKVFPSVLEASGEPKFCSVQCNGKNRKKNNPSLSKCAREGCTKQIATKFCNRECFRIEMARIQRAKGCKGCGVEVSEGLAYCDQCFDTRMSRLKSRNGMN